MTTLALEEERVDVARAARQGMDVSSVPREERCKYPSKFCGNARASKSSGKLHRFCEFHRQRANVNQKRWTKVRRSHKHEMNMEHQTLMPTVDSAWPLQCSGSDLLPASPTDISILPSHLHLQPHYYQPKIHPTLAPRMDATQKNDTTNGLLSPDELYILMSFLLPNESLESVGVPEQATAFPAAPTPHWIPNDEYGITSNTQPQPIHCSVHLT